MIASLKVLTLLENVLILMASDVYATIKLCRHLVKRKYLGNQKGKRHLTHFLDGREIYELDMDVGYSRF